MKPGLHIQRRVKSINCSVLLGGQEVEVSIQMLLGPSDRGGGHMQLPS